MCRSGPGARDAACVLLLCLACLILRLPGLDRLALNPDESQHEAMASFYLASQTSAFADYPALTGTVILLKTMSALFGHYPVVPMRVLVLVIALGMALLLYFMIRTGGSRLAGLLAGLVFLYYNTWFEGFTVNREWYAGLMLLCGAGLYVASGFASRRRRLWLLGASGLACAIALWFKLQGTYMTLAVPAALVLESVQLRRLRRLPAEIGAYALGGAAGVGLYMLGYAINGRLPEATGYFFYILDRYAAAGSGAVEPGWADYLQRFFLGQPFRPLLLVAFLAAAVTLVGVRRADPRPSDRLALIFSTLLLTGSAAVAMGGRFHAHYYLLIMPAVAGLCGLLADAAGSPGALLATRARWLYVVLVPLLIDRAWVLVQQSPERMWRNWPGSVWVVAYTVSLVAVVAWCMARSRRRAAAIVVALLWLEAVSLAVFTHRAGVPSSLPYHPDGFASLSREIRMRAGPGDRLLVWGWLPEVYTRMRLPAASRLVISQFVVRDFGSARFDPAIDRQYEELLMSDLRHSRPRFIVDAWRRSWTMQGSEEPWLYDLRLYPDSEIVALLRDEYRKVGTYDGCDLYARVEP